MINVYTSYFANIKKIDSEIFLVSICGKAPDWYKGVEFKKLATKYWFFKKYKEDHDEDFYTVSFVKEVLGALSQQELIKELELLSGGKDVCLLCYEKPSDFCHRHIVSDWLKEYCKTKEY